MRRTQTKPNKMYDCETEAPRIIMDVFGPTGGVDDPPLFWPPWSSVPRRAHQAASGHESGSPLSAVDGAASVAVSTQSSWPHPCPPTE